MNFLVWGKWYITDSSPHHGVYKLVPLEEYTPLWQLFGLPRISGSCKKSRYNKICPQNCQGQQFFNVSIELQTSAVLFTQKLLGSFKTRNEYFLYLKLSRQEDNFTRKFRTLERTSAPGIVYLSVRVYALINCSLPATKN